ncbi:Protein of unknown function [Pseudidiomarina planktonica]|uniref:Uncharacterized protein n=1 Tax=Pseudidiomarina planktonica TaxID=1323738 RepID=A0A1Y6FW66_9GAMM|nr:zinc-finger-containing protein [Pseudidiomarina planktonica]RUO63953.1 hypothetical protein CWI77_09550 [Pseudidiomarina planktonica]SMQ79961.1 Protein of unknown function [Pseudidiomarina planktonica]
MTTTNTKALAVRENVNTKRPVKPRVKRWLEEIRNQLHYSGCTKNYDWPMYLHGFKDVLRDLRTSFKGTKQSKITGWSREGLLLKLEPKIGESLLDQYRFLAVKLYFDSQSPRPIKTTLGPLRYTCHYCSGSASFRKLDGSSGNSGRCGYVCDNFCDARVGFHTGDKLPLGCLANEELRKLRIKCKCEVDIYAHYSGLGLYKAFEELAKLMKLHTTEVKVARLGVNQCQEFLSLTRMLIKEASDKRSAQL